MSVYILEPVMTGEMVVKVFEHMVICEMKKIVGYMPQMQDGQQDGYLRCLIDLFGPEGFEKSLEIAFEKGKPYLSIVDDIVETHLQGCLQTIIEESNKENRAVGSMKDVRCIESAAAQAAIEYFRNHHQEMMEAVKFS